MSKYISDDWMLENNFISVEEYDKDNFGDNYKIKDVLPGKVNELINEMEVAEVVKNFEKMNVEDIINLLKEKKVKCILGLDDNNKLLGLFTLKHISLFIGSAKVKLNDLASSVLLKEFRVLDLNDPIYFLPRALERHEFILVKESEEKYYLCKEENLLSYILKNKK